VFLVSLIKLEWRAQFEPISPILIPLALNCPLWPWNLPENNLRYLKCNISQTELILFLVLVLPKWLPFLYVLSHTTLQLLKQEICRLSCVLVLHPHFPIHHHGTNSTA
jgi:hypothetical protein